MSHSNQDQLSDGPDLSCLAAEAKDETLAGMHARLVERAASDGLLDIVYRMLDTPVGTLLVAATEQGLVRVAYAREGQDTVLTALADRISPRILQNSARLDPVAYQLEEYFAGRRRTFDLALDRQLSSGFRRAVLAQLSDIGYGQTASYGRIAQAVANPKAVRAVGTACATNPLPLIIPCHRVIRSDGTIGSYAGGAAAKAQLLDLESAAMG